MRRIVLITGMWLALMASSAEAADYTVSTTADPSGMCAVGSCSLRQLIAKIHATPFPPDTIRVPAGTYTLDPALGALQITDNMSIVGAGAKVTTIAMPVPPDRASSGARVFDVQVPPGGATPSVAISGVTVTGGTAHPGNGFFGGNIRSAGTLNLSDAWITNGSAYSGGGVANVNGTLTIERSLISDNHAPYGGGDSGGIMNYGTPAAGTATPDLPGHLVVNNSTVTGNDARLVGGIFSWNDPNNTLVVRNSTIVGNVSKDQPGGPVRLPAGGLGTGNGTELVQNSILVGNVAIIAGVTTQTNCGPLASGGITSLGFNIDSGSDCQFAGGGDLSNTDPMLGPLADNGGATKTFRLSATSPALDRVPTSGTNCPAADQRGIPRPQGPACDVGAFELTVVPASVAPPTINGEVVEGQTLTEAHGTWIYGPTGYAHQWMRCNASGAACGPIAGATHQSYVLASADIGATLRVQEVASNSYGSASPATSAATHVVKRRSLTPIKADINAKWAVFPRYTRVLRLAVLRVPADGKVVVRCKGRKGRGCPFKKGKSFKRKKPTVSLTKAFKNKRLRVGAVIEITISAPNRIGAVRRYRVRPKPWSPKKSTLCLPVGSSKPKSKC